ncbi:MAG: serine/threonine protein kinase [Actinomycetia bacterium]|nr:serine/threonine protein kinase [Actinomycetes bacterium]
MGESVVSPPEMPLTRHDPESVGPYQLVSRLGEGGMGVVYLATDANGRRVAVKVIRPHLASHEAFLDRFRLEVALASKVARFCTAPILDSDTEADPPYIVTEYVHGPTLSAAVAEHGPLFGSELHSLAVGVASALSAIHRAGIVHRDLKPSNVLLSRYGARVIDFGIAKAVDAISSITQTGEMVGSPSYMAPERFRDEPITPATDVFAWGSVLAFAGTGKPPFGSNTESVYYRILHTDPELDGLDPQLMGLARWALRKDPAERPTAQQLLDALLDQSGEPAAATVAKAALAAPTVDTDAHTMAGELPAADRTALAVATSATEPPVQRRRRRRLVLATVAFAVVLALAGSGTMLWLRAHTAPAIAHKRITERAPVATMPMYPAVVIDDKATGPAQAVPGASAGGTVTGLNDGSLQILDPQRNYNLDVAGLTSALLFRSLTGYVQDGPRLRLVGDLATNTGVTTDNGKTWDYTLRPGLKFEDGTPIRAEDVAHGVARSFDPTVTGGPSEIQNWLFGTAGSGFTGKWRPGATPYPSQVTVVAADKIRFTLDSQHPEFPMVAALGTTSPVQAKIDTGAAYSNAPVASGPYRLAPGRTAHRFELIRNPYWKPDSDPIRHNYPDRYVFEDGMTEDAASRRVLAAKGPDRTAFTWNNVDSAVLATAEKTATDRMLRAPSPRMKYLAINTRHTDPAVRKAIAAAIDRGAALAVFGGRAYGRETTTLQSSAMPDYRQYTAPGISVSGDPAKARALLAGAKPTLRYLYQSASSTETGLAKYVQRALGAAGIIVTLDPYPGDEHGYLTKIGEKDNPYDLYSVAWTPDIPDGAGLFDLWNGVTISDIGNVNVSYLNDLAVNTEVSRLLTVPDRDEAAKGYAILDEKLMTDHVPMVPLFERTRNTITGPGVGGLYIDRRCGVVAVVNAYVKR